MQSAFSHRKAISWLILEKILRVLNGILITAAVARHLGPTDYGSLSVALGTVAIFVACASMGAEHINTAELSKRNDEDSSLFFVSALITRFTWACTCLILFIFFIHFSHMKNTDIYLLVSGLIPLSSLSIYSNKLQSDGKFSSYAILNCVTLMFGAVSRLIGIHLKMPMNFFAIMSVIDSFLLTLSYLSLSKDIFKQTRISLEDLFIECKKYFKLCFPTAVSAFLVVIYLRLELFLIQDLLGDHYAGLWAAAMMFITPWDMVSNSILPVANRHLSKINSDNTNYNKKILKLIRIMLLISAAAVTINSVTAYVLIPILLGSKFNEIRDIIPILSVAIIPLFMGSVQEIWIAQQKTTKLVLKKVILGLPISLLLFIYFIGKFGLNGAAIGLVISYFTTAIFMNGIYDKNFLKLQIASLGATNAR